MSEAEMEEAVAAMIEVAVTAKTAVMTGNAAADSNDRGNTGS
jgi:hypothetical protein